MRHVLVGEEGEFRLVRHHRLIVKGSGSVVAGLRGRPASGLSEGENTRVSPALMENQQLILNACRPNADLGD